MCIVGASFHVRVELWAWHHLIISSGCTSNMRLKLKLKHKIEFDPYWMLDCTDLKSPVTTGAMQELMQQQNIDSAGNLGRHQSKTIH